jgi:hypothetical protein
MCWLIFSCCFYLALKTLRPAPPGHSTEPKANICRAAATYIDIYQEMTLTFIKPHLAPGYYAEWPKAKKAHR